MLWFREKWHLSPASLNQWHVLDVFQYPTNIFLPRFMDANKIIQVDKDVISFQNYGAVIYNSLKRTLGTYKPESHSAALKVQGCVW